MSAIQLYSTNRMHFWVDNTGTNAVAQQDFMLGQQGYRKNDLTQLFSEVKDVHQDFSQLWLQSGGMNFH